ncbi:MAG: SDR family NAD(P)-dependent oxidoreductase [Phycisphaerae bacterium]|nr:SDR family NAD(P)-dependent oxidoreductase [Phycisphaerae bacterium]
MLKGKRVLVTGAGGFIGSHLVEALLARGAAVRAFVKYNGRSDIGMLADLPRAAQESLEIVFGNISDPFSVRAAVRGCDAVFHLAALIGIPYSYVAPADYVAVNVQGTLNVLQACRDERTPRVVHTSTSEAYGTAQYVPIDEAHPLQGQSPYSASKIAADKLAESYFRSFDLPVVTVRPFNTFGPRQSARAFIPTVISQALSGDHLRMGALDPVRDMTFVKDTAEGFITVGLSDKAVGEVVNLGVGSGETIGTIARTILRMIGKPEMPIEQDPARVRPAKSEVLRLISNNQRAREWCGWTPRYTLEQGLAETVAWVRQNLDRYRPGVYAV